MHAFLPRDAERYHIEQTWDVLGMRATESNDTILDHTFIPDEYVALVCPAGFGGAGMFQVAIFAWGLLGFATVYRSIAQRAYDETVRRMHRRTSVALTRSMAYHPGVQHEVAEMRIALEAIDGYLGRVIDDWSNHVDHGMEWPLKILAAKYFTVNQAWQVVDSALDLSGGSGIFTRDRMQQMFRDARLGRIHPGQLAADARSRRQAQPRDQPRRAAPLGLSRARAHTSIGHRARRQVRRAALRRVRARARTSRRCAASDGSSSAPRPCAAPRRGGPRAAR